MSAEEIDDMPFINNESWPFGSSTWNEVPAVYGIMDAHGNMIYIGETDNLKRRMAEHLADYAHLMHIYAPTQVCAELITAGEVARRFRERALIAEYVPLANR